MVAIAGQSLFAAAYARAGQPSLAAQAGWKRVGQSVRSGLGAAELSDHFAHIVRHLPVETPTWNPSLTQWAQRGPSPQHAAVRDLSLEIIYRHRQVLKRFDWVEANVLPKLREEPER